MADKQTILNNLLTSLERLSLHYSTLELYGLNPADRQTVLNDIGTIQTKLEQIIGTSDSITSSELKALRDEYQTLLDNAGTGGTSTNTTVENPYDDTQILQSISNLNTALNGINLSNYATKQELNNLSLTGGGLTVEQLQILDEFDNFSENGFSVLQSAEMKIYGDTLGHLVVQPVDGALNKGSRFYIMPFEKVIGTAGKIDIFASNYEADPINYIHWGLNLQLENNFQGAYAVINNTIKSTGLFYGNFPIKLNGFGDNISNNNVFSKEYFISRVDTMLDYSGKHIGPWDKLGNSIVGIGDLVNHNHGTDYRVYKATNSGTKGTIAPIHDIGIETDGSISWEFVKNYKSELNTGKFKALILFGGKDCLPVLNGDMSAVQFNDGFLHHYGSSEKFVNSMNSIIAYKRAINTSNIEEKRNENNILVHKDGFTERTAGTTHLSFKNLTISASVSIDARGVDMVNLTCLDGADIQSIQINPNQKVFINFVSVSGLVKLRHNILYTRLIGSALVYPLEGSLYQFVGVGLNKAVEVGYKGI
jgi:hypothetical protein